MFQLDLRSRKSIYEQIVDNLKGLMISGVLKPEEKLPSVRELSRILTVNPNTIQKAYRELEHQGYAYTAAGLGTFVADRRAETVDSAQQQVLLTRLGELIDEMFYLGLSKDEILSAMKQVLTERGRSK